AGASLVGAVFVVGRRSTPGPGRMERHVWFAGGGHAPRAVCAPGRAPSRSRGGGRSRRGAHLPRSRRSSPSARESSGRAGSGLGRAGGALSRTFAHGAGGDARGIGGGRRISAPRAGPSARAPRQPVGEGRPAAALDRTTSGA